MLRGGGQGLRAAAAAAGLAWLPGGGRRILRAGRAAAGRLRRLGGRPCASQPPSPAPATARPQAILLLGPFVDSEHPSISSGMLDTSYDAVYREAVLARLARCAARGAQALAARWCGLGRAGLG